MLEIDKKDDKPTTFITGIIHIMANKKFGLPKGFLKSFNRVLSNIIISINKYQTSKIKYRFLAFSSFEENKHSLSESC